MYQNFQGWQEYQQGLSTTTMSSLLCLKNSKSKGKVNVLDPKAAEEMLHFDKDEMEATMLKQTFMPRPSLQKMPRVSRKQSGCMLDTTINKLALNFQHPSSRKREDTQEMKKVQNMCDSLLQTEQSFVKEVDKSLKQADILAQRKKELLHKTWSTRVFEPIRGQVLNVVNSTSFADRERRQREIYHQYLEHTNKRGHVFLDTLDKGEYYAQALSGHRPTPVTVYTAPLRDPLLMQSRERNKEDQTILRCLTGEVYSLSDIDQIKLPPMPLVPLGRHNTSCHSWLNMPLGNIVSTPRKASRLRMKGNCTESQIDLSHGTVDQSGGDSQELKTQKRRFVNTPPFDRPPRPTNRPPYALCIDNPNVNVMCPVSA